MATINLSEETKEKFRELKLIYQAKIKESISEDKFLIILLKNMEDF